MNRTKEELWTRFQKYYRRWPNLRLAMDISRMNFPDNYFDSMSDRIGAAIRAMAELEAGAIANPDEKRMVGHYWLRNPGLAPQPELRKAIEETRDAILGFAKDLHAGKIRGHAGAYKNVLLIGIGGSALGPQFVSNALGHPDRDKARMFFFDNTDPDGMERVLAGLRGSLGETLCVVVSKSGGTKETRNGMLIAKAAWEREGLNFGQHAVAVTGAGSELDRYAETNKWLRRFPMWDWVGGRTSELSAVGLLPAALQGIDVLGMLEGAKACDIQTRSATVSDNPAATMALMWHYIVKGAGEKALVLLPYKDRLELFSKYLQQLIMESLGKEFDLNGKLVNQGIAVYGNKGSTDQHAYIQQLREGPNDFFVTFIEVLRDAPDSLFEVEPQVTAGDYLLGFMLGTRQALYEKDRESMRLIIQEISPFTIGVLIALYERTVGLYAHMVGINAYHQPGVEAGKKAAEAVIKVQRRVLDYLKEKAGHGLTCGQIASGIGAHGEFEDVFSICEHLAANGRIAITPGKHPFESVYQHK